jgi:hypothetical protein
MMVSSVQHLNIEKWGVLVHFGYRSISWCPNPFKLENSAFFGVITLMVTISMPLNFLDPFLEAYFRLEMKNEILYFRQNTTGVRCKQQN